MNGSGRDSIKMKLLSDKAKCVPKMDSLEENVVCSNTLCTMNETTNGYLPQEDTAMLQIDGCCIVGAQKGSHV